MNQITTVEELDALPVGSVVLDDGGVGHQYVGDTSEHPTSIWRGGDGQTHYGSVALVRDRAPLTVLHRPDAPAPSAEDLAPYLRDWRMEKCEHYDADICSPCLRDRILAWFATRQPTPAFTPAQREAAEADPALFRIATRALFGTGEVIDIVLRAMGVPVVAPVVSAQTTTEWRVESENYEDEFGTDEAAARDWLRRCNMTPGWEASVLMTRTVTTASTPWQEVNPRG